MKRTTTNPACPRRAYRYTPHAPTTLPRTARVRRHPPVLTLACALAIGIPGLAGANPVTEWHQIAADATKTMPLPLRLRALTMVQIAVHDSLNAIDRRYRPYSTIDAANIHASPAAAVATATHEVLVGLFPTPPGDGYDAYIAALPSCPAARPQCIQDGIAAGSDAASAILDSRSGDDFSNLHPPYLRTPAPGVYQPTAGVPFPVFEGWADIEPFALRDKRQFRTRPSQLLRLRSDEYTQDYEQVQSLGSITARGADNAQSEESRIARFWYGTGGNDWFVTAGVIAEGRDLDPWQNARLLALLAISQVDVTVSVFYNKYQYDFWRPVTAIHWMDDGNPDTTPDPGWSPYLVTPPYPDYPCGTPMLAGAGTEVLRNFFGTDEVPYTVISTYKPPAPGTPEQITRSYQTLTDAAAESAIARVYAGIHFGTGCAVGVAQGEQIGQYVSRHFLQPIRRPH